MIVLDPFFDFPPTPSGIDSLTLVSEPRAYRTHVESQTATVTITDTATGIHIADSLNMSSDGEMK